LWKDFWNEQNTFAIILCALRRIFARQLAQSWIASWKFIAEHARVMVFFTTHSSMPTSEVGLLLATLLALGVLLTHIVVCVIWKLLLFGDHYGISGNRLQSAGASPVMLHHPSMLRSFHPVESMVGFIGVKVCFQHTSQMLSVMGILSFIQTRQ
jgi:hypothetical protein